jgi:hypothetical protein
MMRPITCFEVGGCFTQTQSSGRDLCFGSEALLLEVRQTGRGKTKTKELIVEKTKTTDGEKI